MSTQNTADDAQLVALRDLRKAFPGWPYGKWSTGRLIREGWLGCVRIGRRVYVTPALVRAFITRHTVVAERCGFAVSPEQTASTPTTAAGRAAQRWGINPDGQDGAP